MALEVALTVCVCVCKVLYYRWRSLAKRCSVTVYTHTHTHTHTHTQTHSGIQVTRGPGGLWVITREEVLTGERNVDNVGNTHTHRWHTHTHTHTHTDLTHTHVSLRVFKVVGFWIKCWKYLQTAAAFISQWIDFKLCVCVCVCVCVFTAPWHNQEMKLQSVFFFILSSYVDAVTKLEKAWKCTLYGFYTGVIQVLYRCYTGVIQVFDVWLVGVGSLSLVPGSRTSRCRTGDYFLFNPEYNLSSAL